MTSKAQAASERKLMEAAYLRSMNRLYTDALTAIKKSANIDPNRVIPAEHIDKDTPAVRALMFSTLLEAMLYVCIQEVQDKELWGDIINASVNKIFACIPDVKPVADVDGQQMGGDDD